jgi:hypothetical protein
MCRAHVLGFGPDHQSKSAGALANWSFATMHFICFSTQLISELLWTAQNEKQRKPEKDCPIKVLQTVSEKNIEIVQPSDLVPIRI